MTNSGLSINQRNLYSYFLAHQQRNTNEPCYVPKNFLVGNRKQSYLNALAALERKGLVYIERCSSDYTSWIILPAKIIQTNKQSTAFS